MRMLFSETFGTRAKITKLDANLSFYVLFLYWNQQPGQSFCASF